MTLTRQDATSQKLFFIFHHTQTKLIKYVGACNLIDKINKPSLNLNYISEYKYGKLGEVVQKCEACLQLMKQYAQYDIPNRYDNAGLLHSYLGNVAVHRGNYKEAVKHHSMDMNFGEK